VNGNRYRHFRTAAEISLLAAFLWICFLGLASAGSPTAEERMLRDFGLLPEPPLETPSIRIDYTGAPVPVNLGVGLERRIVFEQPFRLGLEPEAAASFDFEIYDRQLLIRVNRPLTTRARIQLADGRIIPLDIEGIVSAGVTAPLEIIANTGTGAATREPQTPAPPTLALPAAQPGYVELVRFAAQRMYAPTRLFTDWPGMTATHIRQQPVRLIRGARILSTPLASWQIGKLTITAVRLDNQESRRIGLDPRQVVGIWKAAAFHHRSLAPEGSSALYLVSDRAFSEALGIHAEIEVSAMPAGLESRGHR